MLEDLFKRAAAAAVVSAGSEFLFCARKPTRAEGGEAVAGAVVCPARVLARTGALDLGAGDRVSPPIGICLPPLRSRYIAYIIIIYAVPVVIPLRVFPRTYIVLNSLLL